VGNDRPQVSSDGLMVGRRVRQKGGSVLRCIQLVEVVSDYLENTPDDEMLRDTREHLAGSPPCGMCLVQIQTIIGLIGGLSQESSFERIGHGYVPGAVPARTHDNHRSS
jgi:hypothetical protein